MLYIYISLSLYIYIYIHTYIHIHKNITAEDMLQGLQHPNVVLTSTANIYTYTPIIYNTAYIILIRHCKYLLVVVYNFLTRITLTLMLTLSPTLMSLIMTDSSN